MQRAFGMVEHKRCGEIPADLRYVATGGIRDGIFTVSDSGIRF